MPLPPKMEKAPNTLQWQEIQSHVEALRPWLEMQVRIAQDGLIRADAYKDVLLFQGSLRILAHILEMPAFMVNRNAKNGKNGRREEEDDETDEFAAAGRGEDRGNPSERRWFSRLRRRGRD